MEWVLVELNNGHKMPILGIGTFSGFEAEKPMTTSEVRSFKWYLGKGPSMYFVSKRSGWVDFEKHNFFADIQNCIGWVGQKRS